MLIQAHEKPYPLLGPVGRGKQSAFFYLHISYRLDLPGCVLVPVLKSQVLKGKWLGLTILFPPVNN